MITIKCINPEETWMLRHKVLSPGASIDNIKLAEDPRGLHYGLFKEGELISVVSLFIKEREGQFRKFATDYQFQGQGYGTLLFKHLLRQTENYHLSSIWCNARVNAISFYRKFGMYVDSSPFEKGGISYVIMRKEL